MSAARRDLPTEVKMLSDLGRSYMVNWLSFATDETERAIVARGIDKAREYEAEIAAETAVAAAQARSAGS